MPGHDSTRAARHGPQPAAERGRAALGVVVTPDLPADPRPRPLHARQVVVGALRGAQARQCGADVRRGGVQHDDDVAAGETDGRDYGVVVAGRVRVERHPNQHGETHDEADVRDDRREQFDGVPRLVVEVGGQATGSGVIELQRVATSTTKCEDVTPCIMTGERLHPLMTPRPRDQSGFRQRKIEFCYLRFVTFTLEDR